MLSSIAPKQNATAFNPVSTADYLSVSQLRLLQLARVKAAVSRAYNRVEFFHARMDKQGLVPEIVQRLEDLAYLPFSVKDDLRETYPFGLFASPLSDVVRLHASSGTTGKPIVVAYTKADIEVWASVMARTFAACGLHAGDIIQNSYGYGLFTGGLGAHYGAEYLGATVIPASGGNSDRQIMLLKDFGVTAICCTPSYFAHLLERAYELGIDMHTLPLRAAILGAEPWTSEMGLKYEERSGVKTYDIYGLSEIIGPGVASQCEAQNGLHIFEDHFYPEIIDPESGKVLPDGQKGELVLTTLSKEAMPMIRYRTRDITAIIPEQCSCGRTIRRIERIGLRTDDMLIIRGVNIFPSQVEAALMAVEGTLPHYQIILTTEKGLDQMTVEVEVTPEFFSDRIRELEHLKQHLMQSLEQTIGIRVKVNLAKAHTITRSEGKAKRVIDQRNK